MRRLRFSFVSLNRALLRRSEPSARPKVLITWLPLLLALLGLASTAVAQPVNDSFVNATAITGPSGSISGSNVGGTLEAGEPSLAGNPGGQSVWFVWTAPANMTVSFNTFGSDFDTLLGVFTGGAVNALTLEIGRAHV